MTRSKSTFVPVPEPAPIWSECVLVAFGAARGLVMVSRSMPPSDDVLVVLARAALGMEIS